MAGGFILTLLRKTTRIFRWTVAILVLLLLVLIIASELVEEPLRSRIETRMNQHLDGYTVLLPGLDFHLLGFSLTLKDLTIRQDAHPEPSVAFFPRLHASVHWYELLSARLVADFELNHPQIHLNLIQLQEEAADPVPVEERGWQEAFESIYPLRINHLEITGGQITYIDQDPERPLNLSELHLQATNIRNIRHREQVYPSPFRLEAALFQTGRVMIEGHANFLAEPHPGLDAAIELRLIPLDDLQPLAGRANLFVRGGTLDAAGHLEYAPQIKVAALDTLHIRKMHLDYTQSPVTAEIEEKRHEQVRQAAEKAQQDELQLLAGEVRISDSVLGFVNETEDPHYRIFLDDADITLSNFSDGFHQGPARVSITGLFMGSGQTQASATFRAIEEGSDFDLKLQIEDTHLPAMNDLLQAYLGLDTAAGTFSLFSEIEIRGNSISGYIRPFFIDIDIPAPEDEEDKPVIQKVYEWLVGAVLTLLEGPEDELATHVDITGTVDDPEASTLQIIINLILNAFFNIILPGFEGEVEGLQGRPQEEDAAEENAKD
jgi:hypothetical protein